MNNDSDAKVIFGELETLARVELPCFTSSAQVALDMMGGEDFLCRSLKNPTNALQVKFPSGNVIRPNLTATPLSKNGLLIKIRRRKSSSCDTEKEKPDIEILGGVPRSYVFNTTADYQVAINTSLSSLFYINAMYSFCLVHW